MKSQTSLFSFGCCLFYFLKPNPILPQNQSSHLFEGRETVRAKQNSQQTHAPPAFSGVKTKIGHRLFRSFQIQLPPLAPNKPNTFCWGYLVKQKQKAQWNIDFVKMTSASSLVWQGSSTDEPQRPQAPNLFPHPGRLLVSLSTSPSQNHFLCKTSSLCRKNALTVV
jgi:hypothetical protein